MDNNRSGSDLDVVADVYSTQHLRAGADDDIIPDRRVPLALLVTCTAQGDVLIEQHVVADHGGFPDYHAHPVIDEKTPADFRARMDLNAGQEARRLRKHSWDKGYSRQVQ